MDERKPRQVPRVLYDEDEDESSNKPTHIQPTPSDGVPDASVAVREQASRSRAPTAPMRPYLVVVGGRESVGRYYPIEDGMVIGRAVGADIVLDEAGVSRRHARVGLLPDGAFYFEDLGSSNGLLYGGVRVTSQIVREGARIQIGDAVLIPLHIQDAGFDFQKNLFMSATEDPTTRLAHRGYFTSMAERECSLASRYGVPLSLAVLLVDQFHALLQSYGAPAGTIILKSIAHIAKRKAPRGLLVARHGVDQLAVILPETAASAARAWAEEVRSATSNVKFDFTSTSARVTVSGGLASTGEDGCTTMRELTARAEARLAQSKLEGGNRMTM